ncbi:GntR family transcriptional regulator [Marinomonas arenicola]|uniref:GntR family transcriptional regulator n=1 Tax=Marinomonas TaxID=28253 RepID=UPI001056CE00|nr:GntR family transcriptional regulator [Marinomonas sp. KMM3893]
MNDNSFTDELNNLKKQSLSKTVEEQLEKMILSGQIAPGERINESALSASLNISRAPIREACRHMAQYGMVENRVGKGTFVCQVDYGEAVDLYEVRGMLDALAAEKAAVLASDDEIEQLQQLVMRMETLSQNGDAPEYFAANLDFHQTIMAASQNKSLFNMYQVIYKKLSLFRRKNLAETERLRASFAEHEKIFQAIKAKDPHQAALLSRQHVEEAKKNLQH